MSKTTKITAIEIIGYVQQGGALALAGVQALKALRAAIREAGVYVAFDPDSDPRLRDYLASAAIGGVAGAAAGAGIGLLLGQAADAPLEGALIGLVVGALAGALAGIERVDRGWRIRVTWLDGAPAMTVRGAEAS